ncbi:tetratricopeptide repeat protein [Desulfovibrio aerotolerans]|uniref:Tetratricopeptide repeat protein n=1 Tax=Solidesulfovibrio aerotolerans TaxID=295255 RepID=A0A7C9IUK3_9BACT|nr:tetratricopeptide repeat protein [Solidesulfovibrio aerotolerans]MYL81602.1 tetratricopeptide repeat protein [Solidesulfovibrio aerotolerans]
MSLRSFAAPVALATLIACLPGCGAMKFASSEPAGQDSVAAGNAAFDQKDYGRACQELSKAGAGAGAETLTRAGVACAKAGQDKAETSFKAALSANPAYAPAMEGLGQTALSLGDPARARDVLEAAAKAGGHDPRAAMALGDAWLLSGQCDKAQAAYQDALRRDGGLSQAKSRLEATRLLCGTKKASGASAATPASGATSPGYSGSTLPSGSTQPAAPASAKDPGKPAKPATKTIDLNDI